MILYFIYYPFNGNDGHFLLAGYTLKKCCPSSTQRWVKMEQIKLLGYKWSYPGLFWPKMLASFNPLFIPLWPNARLKNSILLFVIPTICISMHLNLIVSVIYQWSMADPKVYFQCQWLFVCRQIWHQLVCSSMFPPVYFRIWQVAISAGCLSNRQMPLQRT